VCQPNSSQSQSAIDQAAIMRAQQEIQNAHLVVALAAPNQTWPEIDHPHILRARSMCDIAGAQADTPIQVSALTGAGLIEFAQAVREKLVPAADLVNDRPWQF
jgi:tRNA U34 5-carboxymethylaminomethyl modifying GTPase MnmE/TrmE